MDNSEFGIQKTWTNYFPHAPLSPETEREERILSTNRRRETPTHLSPILSCPHERKNYNKQYFCISSITKQSASSKEQNVKTIIYFIECYSSTNNHHVAVARNEALTNMHRNRNRVPGFRPHFWPNKRKKCNNN